MMKKEMNREKEMHFFFVIRDAGRSRFKVHFIVMVDGRVRSCISKIISIILLECGAKAPMNFSFLLLGISFALFPDSHDHQPLILR